MERGALAALVRWLRTGVPPEAPSSAEAERLVRTADSQRVAPLLYAALAERNDWPEPALVRLRDLHHASFAKGARQLALVGGVLEALEAAGVRALPMKGAALAEHVYDSVAERPMADVDVLVLEGWSQAVAVLLDRGMQELGRADHAWSFREPQGGVLELHHSVVSCPGLHPLDAEGVWRRSRSASGQVRRRPAPEDLLVQLSLHAAFQHGLVLSLGQYLDFERLIAAEPIEPTLLLRVAEQAAAGPALAASFAVVDALFRLEVDPDLGGRVLEGLPSSLQRWLDAELEDPLRLLSPRPVPLVRVRWGLSQGRRWQLVVQTLSPSPPGRSPSVQRRLLGAMARGVGLLRRWWPLR